MYGIPYVYTCVCARRPRQGQLVHEPSEKSVPSEGTSENLLFIEGIHVDITKMHDGLSKLTA